MEGDQTWGGEYTIQYTGGVLQNGTPETYIIFLTNIAPRNSILIKSSLFPLSLGLDRPVTAFAVMEWQQ